jgi:hypothetical protein
VISLSQGVTVATETLRLLVAVAGVAALVSSHLAVTEEPERYLGLVERAVRVAGATGALEHSPDRVLLALSLVAVAVQVGRPE